MIARRCRCFHTTGEKPEPRSIRSHRLFLAALPTTASPFGSIEIDCSFVHNTTAKGAKPVILRSMVALAHADGGGDGGGLSGAERRFPSDPFSCQMTCLNRGSPMDVTIPLDPELSAFVESKVKSGRFASNGDVIREALNLLRSIDFDEAYSSDELRAAWQAGLDSGDAGEIDFGDLRKEARGRLAR